MQAAKPKDRVTVRLNGELGKVIEEIIANSPASTPTEVVRRAVMVYYNLVIDQVNGGSPVVVFEDDEGKKRRKPVIL